MEQAGTGAPVATSGEKAVRLQGLQYLRALAAVMVAIFHCSAQIEGYFPYLRCPQLATGVDIFFVISGFIMAVTGTRLTAGEFIARRLVRIVPLYWLLTTVLAVLAWWLPEMFRTTVLTPGSYFLSLLFIPFHNAGQAGMLRPLLVPGWSLNYEMFFYAVFAAVLWWRPQRLALLIGLIMGALVVLGSRLPGFYTEPIILEFWLGVLIARTCQRVRLSAVASAGVLVAGMVTLLSTHFFPLQELAAAALVLGVVCWERTGKLPAWRLGAALGDASYSLYLTHLFVLGVTRAVWLALFQEGGHGVGAAGFATVSMVAVLAVALACHRWVEAPITQTLHRLWLAPTRAARPQVRPATPA